MAKSRQRKIKIAIIGCRGIPNNYGGFEQFAENLSSRLNYQDFEITIYSSHNHTNQNKEWNGAKIIHKYDPEYIIGTIGQFFYDFNCIYDCRKRNYDIILQLGYTSSSVWGWLLPKSSVVATNMDGLEWKRNKYSGPVKRFLRLAERLATKWSDHLIADSLVMQEYLKKESDNVVYLSYGADLFEKPDEEVVRSLGLIPFGYNMLIARMVPENNIEVILMGVASSKVDQPFLVIGNCENRYGNYLMNKYQSDKINFLGGKYDQLLLDNLRYHSNIYFHGHSVGGTNPSLLESMASSALICAHNNDFNRSVLGDDALYFANSEDVTRVINCTEKNIDNDQKIANNTKKIKEQYLWENIVSNYQSFFKEILK